MTPIYPPLGSAIYCDDSAAAKINITKKAIKVSETAKKVNEAKAE